MILFFSLACIKDFNGTVVGNPGSASTAQVAPSTDVEYTNASLSIASISYFNAKDCPSNYSPSGDYCPSDESNTIVEDLDITIDLLDSTDNFSLRTGSWTLISIEFPEKPISISGQTNSESFQLNPSLDALTFTADDPYELQGSHILEIASPDWLLNQDLEDISTLEERIRTLSGFYIDLNDDGILDQEDRNDGSMLLQLEID